MADASGSALAGGHGAAAAGGLQLAAKRLQRHPVSGKRCEADAPTHCSLCSAYGTTVWMVIKNSRRSVETGRWAVPVTYARQGIVSNEDLQPGVADAVFTVCRLQYSSPSVGDPEAVVSP